MTKVCQNLLTDGSTIITWITPDIAVHTPPPKRWRSVDNHLYIAFLGTFARRVRILLNVLACRSLDNLDNRYATTLFNHQNVLNYPNVILSARCMYCSVWSPYRMILLVSFGPTWFICLNTTTLLKLLNWSFVYFSTCSELCKETQMTITSVLSHVSHVFNGRQQTAVPYIPLACRDA